MSEPTYALLSVLLYARCDVTGSSSTIKSNSVHRDVPDAGDWRNLLGVAMSELKTTTQEELLTGEPRDLATTVERYRMHVVETFPLLRLSYREEVFQTMVEVERLIELGWVPLSRLARYDQKEAVDELNALRDDEPDEPTPEVDEPTPEADEDEIS